MQIINPATDEIIKEIDVDTKESLIKKYELLRTSQQAWHNLLPSERVKILNNFSDLLEKNIDRLALILTSEVGKPLQQSRNEINGARARIKWLTENAEKYLSDEWMTRQEGLEEKISYEPLGVICNISAWNYPYLVGINVIVPALLAGNAVMYKPSEYATLTGIEIAGLLQQAGLPENIFHVATGAKEVGELLLDLSFDGYFFTGSYKTGKYIYEKVAHKMVPCQCELGGKDPLYVTDDIVNVAAVACGTADGAFYNNGQSCCAVERIYVHEKIYNQYVDKFIKEVNSWKIGLPTEEGVYIGPLSRKNQLAFLEEQVIDALKKGATIIAGGRRVRRKGNFFEPTVLINVTHEMTLMKDESFGPVIGIMKVENDEQAIGLMQDTEYGLTASVYSSDKTRIFTPTPWKCCTYPVATVPVACSCI